MRFIEAVRKLDKLIGKTTYHCVSHEVTTYHNGDKIERKELYAGDLGWYNGTTFEEAFEKLEQALAAAKQNA